MSGQGRGGVRKGAGRPVGSKSKRTLQAEQMRQEMLDAGESPLEFMLKIMRDPKEDLDRRMEAAKTAAPYLHPRLSSVELSGDVKKPIQVGMSLADRVAARQKLLGHARAEDEEERRSA